MNKSLAGGDADRADYDAPEPYTVPAQEPARRRIFGGRSSEPALPARISGEVDMLAQAEEQRLGQLMDAAKGAKRDARRLTGDQRFDEATAALIAAPTATALPTAAKLRSPDFFKR